MLFRRDVAWSREGLLPLLGEFVQAARGWVVVEGLLCEIAPVESLALREFFFFQAEDGMRDVAVTGVQTCALPIYRDALVGARAVRRPAALRDGERRRSRRRAARGRPAGRSAAGRVLPRPSRRRARCAAPGGEPARLLRLVAARQLRVESRLLEAVRDRARGLRDAAAHPQGERPLLRLRGAQPRRHPVQRAISCASLISSRSGGGLGVSTCWSGSGVTAPRASAMYVPDSPSARRSTAAAPSRVATSPSNAPGAPPRGP